MSSIFVEMLTLAIIRWDEANKEKVRLEEKQRGVRKKREQEAELAAQVNLYTNNLMQFSQIEGKNCILQEGRTVDPIEPHWFKLVPDPYNGGKMIHEYRGAGSLHLVNTPLGVGMFVKFVIFCHFSGGYWEAKEKQDWEACADIF